MDDLFYRYDQYISRLLERFVLNRSYLVHMTFFRVYARADKKRI